MKLLSAAILIAATMMSGVTAQAKNGILYNNLRMTPMAMPMASSNLMYYGGPVISHARVATVFWGTSIDAALTQGLPAFYNAYVNHNVMDWMNQYQTNSSAVDGCQGTNQAIGKGSYIGEFVIHPKNTSMKISDTDIQAELEYQVSQNVLPKPDDNTLYMIHFPGGLSITVDGISSCSSFCAYHNGTKSAKYGNMFYGVMPDLGSGMCSFTCAIGATTFESTTYVSSHELTEAVTDAFPTPGDKPAYPQAWNTVKGEEIADLCSSPATLNLGGKNYSVTKLWDNKTGACSGNF